MKRRSQKSIELPTAAEKLQHSTLLSDSCHDRHMFFHSSFYVHTAVKVTSPCPPTAPRYEKKGQPGFRPGFCREPPLCHLPCTRIIASAPLSFIPPSRPRNPLRASAGTPNAPSASPPPRYRHPKLLTDELPRTKKRARQKKFEKKRYTSNDTSVT